MRSQVRNFTPNKGSLIMSRLSLLLIPCLAWLAGCAAVTPQPTPQPKPQLTAQPTATELKQQVAATETAFAKTMADRDHAAFTSFLADEAVFLGGATPL